MLLSLAHSFSFRSLLQLLTSNSNTSYTYTPHQKQQETMASSADIYPSPPPYEAIGRPLEDHLNIPQPGSSNLTPRDFGTITSLQNDDDRDMEEERDYEESRPLKMGRIPDARAQYTFIQPSDTINNVSAAHGPFSRIQELFHHQQPHNPVHHSSHSQSSNPYFNPPPSLSAMPPSPSSSTLRQQQEQQPRRRGSILKQSESEGQETSSVAAGTSSSTSYAPPPFPPPQQPILPAPLAGVPETPGFMNAQDVSIADYKRTKRGADSCDKILEDPYQLYRFFVAHNDRPSMHVLICGHHTEKSESYETDSDGNRKLVSRDVRVDDFKIDFDLTPYISPRGTLYTAPDPKIGKTSTIREAMEQFAMENNPFKEMHMHKTVAWDYEELTRAITHAIRAAHYRYTIEISYPCTNNLVIVRSSSPAANFMRNRWTKALCFISLVGFILYPAVSP
ncbi:hypothetical protein BC939DRAFT_459711 [Gamsiella multidivaricata]|uniref:uncharacterized protein n=1 Tax=Gamsiella multidivaricata TaxID=101098 RepID=UPI00222008F8|nr:uncharacterized protein BC939DRAFT_459711 [Gamsiella multidivaricata]KAI7819599.1 hypothetical protein BC939DRAFT_459711 [Gamsiella multidivaricata]